MARTTRAKARNETVAARPAEAGFDLLVLTVANGTQRRYAEHMLEFRRRLGALPPGLRTLVVADPAGRRIGSGGSTLLCLDLLRRRGLDRGRRVLLLHSGGDSRRLPAWSAFGKIWVPLGREGRDLGPMNAPALFDLVLAELSTLVLPPSGGVLVASGDAALRLTGERVAFDERFATVLAFPGEPARAARHGVFVTDRSGLVLRTLQKPSRRELAAAGALDARGRAAVDSGIFHFPPPACAALLNGARGLLPRLRRGTASLDLYQEVADAMAAGTRPVEFVGRFAPGDGAADRTRARLLLRFHACMRRVRLRAAMLSAGSFLHLGSTRELVERLASGEPERMFPDRLGGRRKGPPAHEPRIELVASTRGGCITEVPVPGGTCTAAHGIDDDCKAAADAGGTACGRPLSALPARTGLDERAIWGDDPRTLWFARLHPVAAGRGPVDWLLRGTRAPAAWRRARRLSFAQLALAADADAAAARDFVAHHLPRPAGPRGAAPLDRARALAAASAMVDSPSEAEALNADALELVGEAASTEIPMPPVVRRFAVRPGDSVEAASPVRIDLAGGWSDTPPLCIEHGGAVANAALRLDGCLPLRAEVRVTDEPCIVLRSVDARRSARYRHVRTLLDHQDPRRWDALPRAALVLSGIVPRDPRADLRAHLERAGGGLEITVSSDVPRGSGLGTSSILGATLLAALDRAAGRPPARARLARGASLLEQMIRTRGGWQDQVGGLWGGMKLCTTQPGAVQRLHVRPVAAPPEFMRALRERSFLLYSGQRRMARNILRTVVLRYLRGDPAVLDARRRLVAGAHLMAEAVRAGDLDEFAFRLAEYRDLKRTVDPASVTPALEAPVAGLGKELSAWSFAGAGGGGFLLLVARSAAAARRIRDRLDRHPPHPRARTYPLEPDDGGLAVTVARARRGVGP